MHHLVRQAVDRVRKAIATAEGQFVGLLPADLEMLRAASERRDLPRLPSYREMQKMPPPRAVYLSRDNLEEILKAIEEVPTPPVFTPPPPLPLSLPISPAGGGEDD